MTSRALLQASLDAFNQIKDHRGLFTAAEGAEELLGDRFSSYDLAARIAEHLKETKGFTVILGYPDSGETYSSSSHADTWEEAVLEVAADMRDDEPDACDEGDITIVDVFEGYSGHASYSGTDRYAVVRISEEGELRLLDQNQQNEEFNAEMDAKVASGKLLG